MVVGGGIGFVVVGVVICDNKNIVNGDKDSDRFIEVERFFENWDGEDVGEEGRVIVDSC